MNAPRTEWRTTFPGLWLLVWPVLRCLLPSAAQVLAGGTLFPQVVVDPFPLDRQLHLRQRGHGGEHYAAHRSAGVDVAAVEVQDTEIDALRSSSEKPIIQRGHDRRLVIGFRGTGKQGR